MERKLVSDPKTMLLFNLENLNDIYYCSLSLPYNIAS